MHPDTPTRTDHVAPLFFLLHALEQKTATAVAYCKRGRGLIKVNGCPIELLEPAILRVKTFEPVLLLGPNRFSNVDIRVRVRGGGYTSQVCSRVSSAWCVYGAFFSYMSASYAPSFS